MMIANHLHVPVAEDAVSIFDYLVGALTLGLKDAVLDAGSRLDLICRHVTCSAEAGGASLSLVRRTVALPTSFFCF